MRFQCDRCSTRYSIPDERVRGKILKIRCKSCEAVITVREGMESLLTDSPMDSADLAASQGPEPTVLSGARAGDVMPEPQSGRAAMSSRQATEQPPPLRGSRPLPVWYVSIHGEQTGPLTVGDARAWIAARPPYAEIYCWREGFDDWKPVVAVPELAVGPGAAPAPPAMPDNGVPLDQPAAASGLAASLPLSAREPEPAGVKSTLPGGLLAQAAASGNAAVISDDMFGAAAGGDDLDFNISEPSRVVNLDMMVAQRSPAARGPGQGQPVLPGMAAGSSAAPSAEERPALGRGTGSVQALLGSTPPAPGMTVDDSLVGVPAVTPRRRSTLPIVIGVAALLSAAGALAFIILGDSDSAEDSAVSGHVPSDFENLGYQVDKPGRNARKPSGSEQVKIADDTSAGRSSDSPGKSTRRNGSSDSGDSRSGSKDERGSDTSAQDDPMGRGTEQDSQALTPLSIDEVIQKSSSSEMGFRRCYERAKKKDPFLEVTEVKIELSVNAAGEVANVKFASHGDTLLGQCLAARVRQWKFRPSTSGITAQIPVKFERH